MKYDAKSRVKAPLLDFDYPPMESTGKSLVQMLETWSSKKVKTPSEHSLDELVEPDRPLLTKETEQIQIKTESAQPNAANLMQDLNITVTAATSMRKI
jgi:hypothetical protein